MEEEAFSWLKSLPSAPEFHPTITEFQDPISYIFKIEQEASKFGICKIIPPVPVSSNKTITDSLPTFTTRKQRVGFSPLKHRKPTQRSVWQSGQTYSLPVFETKARKFKKEMSGLNESLTPLEIEIMYWKAQANTPIVVEYANDMPGSVFEETGMLEESDWNLRKVARSNGSLLKFVKADMPGVTSPMVYVGMLYSWFGWHVEDHDLHSMNYMHMGEGKTWYGVPMEAAFEFEELMRKHACDGKINPSVPFAILSGKTTIVSPEVLIKAGVPCCRLVQNPGEFVVTFPRAYHCGFSHGFNCAEAVNIATPRWLLVAKEAAIRRVAINVTPMFSYSQLLYDLARSLFSSKQESSRWETQSTQLREGLNYQRDAFVKQNFVRDVIHNNELLNALGNGSPITLLSEDVLESLVPHDSVADPESIFKCVTCGSPCHSYVAIVQPLETAKRYFMSNEDVDVMHPGFSSGKLPKSDSTTRDQKDISVVGLSVYEKDSSRLHVFCLEHAREVESQLRSVGGVHMLLLCHQDYQEINNAARVMDKELGISDDTRTDVKYKDITEQDKMMIQWALDDKETATGDQDWAVKLGINIFYSAKLGSPLNKKQMPYNAVIYKAFRQDPPSSDHMTAKQSGSQKEDDDDDNQKEDHITVSGFPKMNVNHENTRKRKKTLKGKFLEMEASRPSLPPSDSENESDYDLSESLRRRITHKPAKKQEVGTKSKVKKDQNQALKGKKASVVATSEEEEGSDLAGCDMRFKSEQDLKMDEQEMCPVGECGRDFHLPKHLVNDGDPPLKCLWCEMTFKCSWAHMEHTRVHLKAQHYLCVSDECGEKFKFMSEFNLHTRNTGHLNMEYIKG